MSILITLFQSAFLAQAREVVYALATHVNIAPDLFFIAPVTESLTVELLSVPSVPPLPSGSVRRTEFGVPEGKRRGGVPTAPGGREEGAANKERRGMLMIQSDTWLLSDEAHVSSNFFDMIFFPFPGGLCDEYL